MKSVKKSRVTISIGMFIVLLIVASIFNFTMLDNIAKTYGLDNDNKINEDVNAYMDSDMLYGDSTKNINDYNTLIGQNAAIVATLYSGAFRFSINHSLVEDDITKIIPKDYFYIEGNHLEIGKEYGFYIKTQWYLDHYESVALVFDIITNTNFVQTIDRIKIQVKPIFQYEYIGLIKGLTSVQVDNMLIQYNIDDNLVVPKPTSIEYSNGALVFDYNMCDKYYLKDISIGASLFNEQKLNRGDNDYNPYQDVGMFFTQYDYEYNGRYREYGEFPTEQFYGHVTDVFMFGVGLIPTPLTEGIATIYDVHSLVKDNIALKEPLNKYYNGTIEETEKKLSYTCYYNNRNSQLNNYKDDFGVPYLIKAAAFTINTTMDKSIWYGVNDSVTGYFTVADSAIDIKANYTRFVKDIALKIVDSNSDEVIITSNGVSIHHIGNPDYKTIELDSLQNVYILPYGSDYFQFNSIFASDYDIIIASKESLDIFIDNKLVYSGNDLNISQYIGEECNTKIKIRGKENCIITTILISPSINTDNFNINSESNYILKVESLLGIKKIYTNKTDILIKEFYVKRINSITSYSDGGDITPYNKITYPFIYADATYYIIFINLSSAKVENINISITAVDELIEGSTNKVTLLPYGTYFKFKSSSGGQYIQTILDETNTDFHYKILDSNFKPITNGIEYTPGELHLSFDENNDYYILIKNNDVNDEKNVSVVINKAENAYMWESRLYLPFSSALYVSFISTYGREICLPRGATFHLRFWVNGQLSDATLYSEDDVNNKYGGYGFSVKSNGFVTIPALVPVGGSGITVSARYLDTDLSYNNTLKLIPTFTITEDAINLNSVNNESLALNFTVPKYVVGYDYKLTIGEIEKIFSANIQSNQTSVTKDIFSDYQSLGYDGVGYITISLVKLHISTANGAIDYYNCNFSTQIHNSFYDGDGNVNNPFTITAKRHYDNVKKIALNGMLKYSFKLLNNIYSSEIFSEESVDFYGVFDGNNYGIYNIKLDTSVYSTSNRIYGFFRYNYGTIKNLKLSANLSMGSFINVSPFYTIGAICGVNVGKITNCSANIYFSITNGYVGGIAGQNRGIISSCEISGNIYLRYDTERFISSCVVGGIVGVNNNCIENSISRCNINTSVRAKDKPDIYYINGSVRINLTVGGLIGNNLGDYSDSTFTSFINFSYSWIYPQNFSRTQLCGIG